MAVPGWMNNPADFIRVVHALSGKTNREALKREIATVRAEIDRMGTQPEPSASEPAFVTGVDLVPVVEAPIEVLPPEAKTVEVVPAAPFDYEQAHLLTELASLSNLTQIKEKLSKEEFEGKLDPRTLSATDHLQWLDLDEEPPHQPWITAYFINDGDSTVEIGINHTELKRQQIKKSETLTIDQTHAEERIKRLFYVCAAGETASVRVVGQY